jgi:hypothetical protein
VRTYSVTRVIVVRGNPDGRHARAKKAVVLFAAVRSDKMFIPPTRLLRVVLKAGVTMLHIPRGGGC